MMAGDGSSPRAEKGSKHVAAQPAPEAGARGRAEGARERILTAAYDLFSRHGISAVGVDAIIARAGVAKMSLYRHFRSKDELVVAFLERRRELWRSRWLEAEIARREHEPQARLLAIFDVFDGWFQEPGFEGCSFINVLLQAPKESDVGRAAARQLAEIRGVLAGLAAQAGLADADRFARAWHILMKGAIVAAGEGQGDAARVAQEMARLILADWPRQRQPEQGP
jgi:AcrR family transcriptional regulator